MATLYIRASDGMTVDRSEACTPGGMVRSGYSVRVPTVSDAWKEGEYIGFDITLADRAPSPSRVTFRDGVTLTDAVTALAVAHAEREHRTRTAYLGAKAPTFSDAQRTAAVDAAASAKRTTNVTDAAAGIRHAEAVTARVLYDAARATRRADINTAWKRA